MNMDDKKSSKVWKWQDVCNMQSGRIIMKHVYISLKKDGLIGKLYVMNLALTGLSTTACISLQNILKIHFIVMDAF